MKKLILLCSVLTALTLQAAPQGATEQRAGDSLTFKAGSALVLGANSTTTLAPTASAPQLLRVFNLGAPALAATNAIVTSANMTVGNYTIADTTPDVPRNLTVTRTAVGVADTGGNITVTGTDIANAALTEVINVGANGVTVAGTHAFKTVTAVTGAGWVTNNGTDTVVVGTGTKIGLPYVETAAAGYVLGVLSGGTVTSYATTGNGTLSLSTVDASAGTYNGTKVLTVYPAY